MTGSAGAVAGTYACFSNGAGTEAGGAEIDVGAEELAGGGGKTGAATAGAFAEN